MVLLLLPLIAPRSLQHKRFIESADTMEDYMADKPSEHNGESKEPQKDKPQQVRRTPMGRIFRRRGVEAIKGVKK